MKKLYYFIIPALLLGSCQSDPTLETESSPLVRTKVTELQYAQTDKIDVEALNIISPYKFVKKGNLYAFLTPSSAYRFAIYDSENGTVTRLVPAGRNEGEGMYFISMNLNGDIVSAFDFGTKKFVEINLKRLGNRLRHRVESVALPAQIACRDAVQTALHRRDPFAKCPSVHPASSFLLPLAH